MRIELKDENTEEITEEKEPELKDKHESDLTGKEKRELERQKLQSMNFTGKLQYIWAYYKAHIFVLIGIIVLIFIVKDTYNNANGYVCGRIGGRRHEADRCGIFFFFTESI